MQITIIEEDLDKSIEIRKKTLELIANNHKFTYEEQYSCNCLLATALRRILNKVFRVSWFSVDNNKNFVQIEHLSEKTKDDIVIDFDMHQYDKIRSKLPYTCEVNI